MPRHVADVILHADARGDAGNGRRAPGRAAVLAVLGAERQRIALEVREGIGYDDVRLLLGRDVVDEDRGRRVVVDVEGLRLHGLALVVIENRYAHSGLGIVDAEHVDVGIPDEAAGIFAGLQVRKAGGDRGDLPPIVGLVEVLRQERDRVALRVGHVEDDFDRARLLALHRRYRHRRRIVVVEVERARRVGLALVVVQGRDPELDRRFVHAQRIGPRIPYDIALVRARADGLGHARDARAFPRLAAVQRVMTPQRQDVALLVGQRVRDSHVAADFLLDVRYGDPRYRVVVYVYLGYYAYVARVVIRRNKAEHHVFLVEPFDVLIRLPGQAVLVAARANVGHRAVHDGLLPRGAAVQAVLGLERDEVVLGVLYLEIYVNVFGHLFRYRLERNRGRDVVVDVQQRRFARGPEAVRVYRNNFNLDVLLFAVLAPLVREDVGVALAALLERPLEVGARIPKNGTLVAVRAEVVRHTRGRGLVPRVAPIVGVKYFNVERVELRVREPVLDGHVAGVLALHLGHDAFGELARAAHVAVDSGLPVALVELAPPGPPPQSGAAPQVVTPEGARVIRDG